MENTNKKLVIIGGGTGLSTVIRGLKKKAFDITAIVTVADDGGSSGRLRDDYDIPPPGDIRNVIAALSDVEPLVEKMFQYRFSHSDTLGGHSLGNLMLTALTDITGDFTYAIAEMCKVLNVNGKVLPATNKKVILHAELTDGTYIEGESRIPNAHAPVKRVFLTPIDVPPLPAAVRAIHSADYILIGPGSLYTSIIPNLLVEEIKTAILRSKAEKIYICNLMTQKGETLHYTAADHVESIHAHTRTPFIDKILVNNFELPPDIIEHYQSELATPVIVDKERIEAMGIEVIEREMAFIKNDTVRHHAWNLAEWLEQYNEQKQNKRKTNSAT